MNKFKYEPPMIISCSVFVAAAGVAGVVSLSCGLGIKEGEEEEEEEGG